jgi:hypothetical protein
MNADEFLTDNLTLGAFIEVLIGARAMMRPNKDGLVTMVFADCEAVRHAQKAFFADAPIRARTFSRRVAVLRQRCRELRSSIPVTNANDRPDDK